MVWNARARALWEGAALVMALAVVALVVIHPHANALTGERREYPVHMDEYVHWGYAKATIESGEIDAPDPFTGGGGDRYSVAEYLHERGFHAYLGAVQDATGVAWKDIFTFGPTLVALVAALGLYAVARRWGAGIEAVLWFAAVPTTLRFLGPGFLVPIMFTLPILAVGLLALSQAPDFRTYAMLGILSASLWPIHVMGALMLLAMCLLTGLASATSPSRAAALAAVAALPAILALPAYMGELGSGTYLPDMAHEIGLLHLAGLPLFAAAAIGVPLLVLKRHAAPVAFAIAMVLLLAEFVVVRRMLTGEDIFRMYDRTRSILPFLAVIPAAVAVASARRALTSRIRIRPLAAAVVVLALVAQGAAVATAARAQMSQVYYEPVTPARFDEYLAVAPQLQGRHHLAIVQGQTMPFTLATGIPTLYVFFPSGGASPDAIKEFFDAGASDTLFLLKTGASVVVSEQPLKNPYLEQISPTVYVLRPDILDRLEART